jgi:hypothetical protein
MLRYTPPDHEHYKSLQQALDKINEVVLNVNRAKLIYDQHERMTQISAELQFPSGVKV